METNRETWEVKPVPGENQLLTNMLRAAKERLSGRDPQVIARSAGVSFEGDRFQLRSLGREIQISVPELDVTPDLPQWQMLTLLHYLDIADGTSLSGRQTGFADYRDGMARGGTFDRDAEAVVREKLGRMEPSRLAERCIALGARMLDSNADLCAQFDFAPRYPVWLKIWFADDELEASGRMFVDGSAGHYLTIEDAVTVGSLILGLLTGETSWM